MDSAQSSDKPATPANPAQPVAPAVDNQKPATPPTTPPTSDTTPAQANPTGTPPAAGTPPASPLGNKKFIYIIAAIGVFLLLLIIITIAASSKSSKQQQQQKPNVSAITPTKVPTPTTNPLPTQNFSPEVSQLKTQAKPQIDTKVNNIPYTIAFVKLYSSTWAIVEITNPTTDPANVVLKKVNNYWNVVLGPGTYFDGDTLNTLGAPEQLVNDANTVFVQPVKVNPSAEE
jgi:hypothetical protein